MENFFFEMWPSDQFEFETPVLHSTVRKKSVVSIHWYTLLFKNTNSFQNLNVNWWSCFTVFYFCPRFDFKQKQSASLFVTLFPTQEDYFNGGNMESQLSQPPPNLTFTQKLAKFFKKYFCEGKLDVSVICYCMYFLEVIHDNDVTKIGVRFIVSLLMIFQRWLLA